MKKRYKKAPDPRIKHRVQIGETTLYTVLNSLNVFMSCKQVSGKESRSNTTFVIWRNICQLFVIAVS